jgi:hypothetical protein
MDCCWRQYDLPGQQREEVLVGLRILGKARRILLVFESVLFAIVRGRLLFRRQVVGMSEA